MSMCPKNIRNPIQIKNVNWIGTIDFSFQIQFYFIFQEHIESMECTGSELVPERTKISLIWRLFWKDMNNRYDINRK